jgi:membrane protein
MVAQSRPISDHDHGRGIRAVYPLLTETAKEWMQDNAMRMSAALSLYSTLSLAPLLVVTVKFIGLISKGQYAHQQIVSQLTNLLGPQIAQALEPMISTGSQKGGGVLATGISLVVLLFSATGVFIELQDSMNTIWGVKPKPGPVVWGFIRNRILSLSMIFGIAFLLLISMFITTALTGLAHYFAGSAKPVVFTADLLASFVVLACIFAAMFKFLPDVKIAWRHVWLGAVITAALFTLGKYCLALYFKFASPTSAFGAAGSLAAVLLWVYYSSFILFFGAEFTKVWARHHTRRVEPEEHAVKITEEDRAHQGIPTPSRMGDALAREQRR